LSLLIPTLDRFCEHSLAHTGQNRSPLLSDVFFREFGLREPDIHFGIQASGFGAQVAAIVEQSDDFLAKFRPDRVVILGDTNSGLAAIAAARRRIPVYHLEAGNRCFDDRVPEELNRRLIDHCSTVLMPYTERSKDNLLREGIERDRIFVIGNPIFEVLNRFDGPIASSKIHETLGVRRNGYFLATMHRAENVDDPARLKRLVAALDHLAERKKVPIIVSVHPRTADRLASGGIGPSSPNVRLIEPLGFFDFVCLERHALCVLTDSGTVQEECSIMGVPNVTIRDVTERAETIEVGSNIIAGDSEERIVGGARRISRPACVSCCGKDHLGSHQCQAAPPGT
jgi:UDP-N-acetylglucosamine 2-epimerase (non-hydrolysing)